MFFTSWSPHVTIVVSGLLERLSIIKLYYNQISSLSSVRQRKALCMHFFTPQLAGKACQLECHKIVLDYVHVLYIFIYYICLCAPQCCIGNT